MRLNDLALLTRRDRVRIVVLLVALVAAVLWAWLQIIEPGPPRRIVLASGSEFGLYHQYAKQYVDLLKREGLSVEVRTTDGAGENLRLLLDRKSGVDVAFMQGGVAEFPAADGLVMLASLYYEPLWIFYRGPATYTQINHLDGKRLAVGLPGSGTRVLVDRILGANGMLVAKGIARGNTELVALGGPAALDALKAGDVDAAFYVGGIATPVIQRALRDPAVKLMSLARADAYPQRFPYLSRLTLHAGAVDFGSNVPDRDVGMIATKAMLAAREDLHPALINLLVDSVRDVHDDQGTFEVAGEFPGTAQIDLRVSPDADRHKRFGANLLSHYLPFWIAAIVERLIVVLVPLLVVIVPLMSYLPQIVRWRVRSRVYRWYGELALLERDVASRKGTLPIEDWLANLDRIEHAVEHVRTPASFASEAYTLREHIGLVRRTVLARAGGSAPAAGG